MYLSVANFLGCELSLFSLKIRGEKCKTSEGVLQAVHVCSAAT